jgi:hypothetical protein
MYIYEKRLTRAGRRARGGMSGHPEREGRGGGGGQPCSTENQIPDSEFPSFRGPSVGPQRDPNIQIPCFQVCRFQDTPLQIPDSEFPSFQGPSVGPRKDHAFQFPKLFLHSRCTDSWILLRKFQIPRFRVCRFQDTLCKFQIPSFRVSEAPSWVRSGGTPKFQIPSFRVSEEHPTSLGSSPKGPPNSRFRVSEFPRPPLRSKADGIPNSRFRVSEFPRTPLGSQDAARGTHKFPDQVSECNT